MKIFKTVDEAWRAGFAIYDIAPDRYLVKYEDHATVEIAEVRKSQPNPFELPAMRNPFG